MQQLTVQLPDDLAAEIDLRVRSGEFSSASDLVERGVASILTREPSMLDWLREEVLPGHAEFMADRSAGIPADEILSRIRHRRGIGSS